MIYSHNTANTMVPPYYPPYYMNTPSRMHEPRPDSRLNHNADPVVHEMYREFVHNLRSFLVY